MLMTQSNKHRDSEDNTKQQHTSSVSSEKKLFHRDPHMSPVSLVILDSQTQHEEKKSTLTLFLFKLQGHYGKAGVSSFAAGLSRSSNA